jgi:hypothetical protein
LYNRNVANSAEEFLPNTSRPDQQTTSSQEKIELKREVGLFSAVNIIIGVMIGNDLLQQAIDI